MKSFFKILLLVVLALLAIKLLPLTLALGFVCGIGLIGLVAAGLSVVATLTIVALVVVAVLSPIWIPVMLLLAFIAVLRRLLGRSPARSS